MLLDFETSVSERSEPGRVAFARFRRTSPEPEGRRREEAAAPKARAAGIRPSSPSEKRGEASARGAREHWKKPGMLLDFETSGKHAAGF